MKISTLFLRNNVLFFILAWQMNVNTAVPMSLIAALVNKAEGHTF